jgi:hypothetical protein
MDGVQTEDQAPVGHFETCERPKCTPPVPSFPQPPQGVGRINGPSYDAPFNCSYRDYCNQSSPCYRVVPPPGSSGRPAYLICQAHVPPFKGGTSSDELWGCALIIRSVAGSSIPVFVDVYIKKTKAYDGTEDIPIKSSDGFYSGFQVAHGEGETSVMLLKIKESDGVWDDLSVGAKSRSSVFDGQKVQLEPDKSFACTAKRREPMLARCNRVWHARHVNY